MNNDGQGSHGLCKSVLNSYEFLKLQGANGIKKGCPTGQPFK